MSLVVAAPAPPTAANVGILFRTAAPPLLTPPSVYDYQYCSSASYRHHAVDSPAALCYQPSEGLPECSDSDNDDEVLKIRRMQEDSCGDDFDDEEDARLDNDRQLDAKVSMELPLSPASCILSDSFCCFSDAMEEVDLLHRDDDEDALLHSTATNLLSGDPRPPRRGDGGQRIGVRIDEGRNTYHSPPNHHCSRPGLSSFPASFMVQMGLAVADDSTSDESWREDATGVGSIGSSWLQAADYAAIKRDNVKTLLTIQQRIQNPESHYQQPVISIVDGCVVDTSSASAISGSVDNDSDEVCPRGLETVIEKLIRGSTNGDARATTTSISHQRRVSQLIVQLYKTHKSLRSNPHPEQPQPFDDELDARAFWKKPSDHVAGGGAPATRSSSLSTLEDDIRDMYQMVSHTDRVRALSLADQDARDVGHSGERGGNGKFTSYDL